jgi:hypothetical protein
MRRIFDPLRLAITKDLAIRGLMQTVEQSKTGRFPRAVFAAERVNLSGSEFEIHTIKNKV